MPTYQSTKSEQLALKRKKRRLSAKLRGDHPLSHIDPDTCYEWMRADCAEYETARQAREDGLITTTTQISSAALLAIPGLIFGSSRSFPAFVVEPWLYVGVFAFLITLLLSMLEQFLSGMACKRKVKIAQEYYFKKSDQRGDPQFTKWLRRCRHGAYLSFVFAVTISAFALAILG